MKRLKAQIEALEKAPVAVAQAPATLGGYATNATNQPLGMLMLQRMSVQQNLETTSQKLAAARRGENLERDQFSERLEVLEQAVPPQRPIKPKRPQLIALAFAAAVMAGFAGIWGVELIDKTVRSSRDLVVCHQWSVDSYDSLSCHPGGVEQEKKPNRVCNRNHRGGVIGSCNCGSFLAATAR